MRIILGVMAAVLLAPTAARAQAEEVVYYHTDAIGSVRAVTDATGDVIARYDFLPFGESWLPPASQDSRQFAGKERDAESGLDYFGARYHKAGIGRFTTVDPVMNIDAAAIDPQRWNRYAYAKNNPFVFVDPDGREVWLSSAHQRALAGAGQRAAPAVAVAAGVAAIAVLVEAGPVAWRAAGSCFLSPSCQSLAIDVLEGAAGGPPRLSAGSRANVASVEELVTMMNKRAGVTAEFAMGDAAAYLERVGAEGSHMLLEGGQSNILLRADVATRRTALHEWLHRMLQKRSGGPTPGEDRLIEDFLNRHRKLFRLEEQ